MTEQMAGQLLNAYLEIEVPAAVDLWPAIRQQVIDRQVARVRSRSGFRPAGWRFPALAATAMALALALVLAFSPAARAELLAIIQRYGFMVNLSPDQSRFGASPSAGVAEAPSMLSLADAERQLQFALPRPQQLPSGFGLQGVVVEGPDAASIIYAPGIGSDRLALKVARSSPQGGEEVDALELKPVLIGRRPGLLAEDVDPTGVTTTRSVTWSAGRFTYVLSSFGGVSRSDLLAAANSVATP